MIFQESMIRVGELIRVGFSVGEGFGLYGSRVEDITASGILVAWPTDHLVQVPVEVGQEVVVEVRSDRGVFRLDSRVLSRSYQPFPTLLVARHGTWTHEQRRQHVRLEITIFPSEVLLVEERSGEQDPSQARSSLAGRAEGESGEEAGRPIAATVRNLSAGGMLLTTEVQIDPESRVRIKLPLATGQSPLVATARVVWVEWDALAGKQRHKAGCQFQGLTTKEQDMITRFVFSKQIEKRRLGML